ncbi:MAG TPA: hypothetical protein VEY91_01410 [Candidatus Limnocylindria bacterium]|nr:hypothetical protein [Candidatus Limnocylindria bacterium]
MRLALGYLALMTVALVAPASARAADKPVAASDTQSMFDRLTAQVATDYDTAQGGFARRGMPATSAVELALVLANQTDSEWQSRALWTVDWTQGLMDTIGGGFIHSVNDPEMARLEKRTNSNAQRLENLIDAWQVTGNAAYRRRAAGVVDFFERVLLDARGGFVAGQIGDRSLEPAANGFAIHAYLRWAAATGERRYLNFALKSVDRVWQTSWDPNGGLLRRGTFGEILEYPQLEDQVEMGRALVLAAQLGKRPEDLERARTLGELLLVRFEDPRGGFRTQSALKKSGEVKKAARVESENSRAARFLCELAAVTRASHYGDAAARAWTAFAKEFEKSGPEGADWALAMRVAMNPRVVAVTEPRWQAVAKSEPMSQPRSVQFKTGRR